MLSRTSLVVIIVSSLKKYRIELFCNLLLPVFSNMSGQFLSKSTRALPTITSFSLSPYSSGSFTILSISSETCLTKVSGKLSSVLYPIVENLILSFISSKASSYDTFRFCFLLNCVDLNIK